MAALAALAALAAGLSACGSDGPVGTEPTESGAASPSESASADPASDWKTAELEGTQFKAPPDWDVSLEDGVSYVLSSPKDELGYRAGRGIHNAGSALALSTDELAATSRDSVIGDYAKVERLQDVKFGGTTFFHIRGSGAAQTYDLYGALIGDIEVSVAWSFNPDLATREQIDGWINQVMPSFKFVG
jgi:predicted small lipoprotein YifL